MSVKVSSWVWHGAETSEVAGNEMILLLALADVADDNGRCRFMTNEDDLTYEGLSRKVRVDRRTIERLIPRLRERGLLAHSRGSKARPNEFQILVPWAQGFTDNLSGNAAGGSPTAVQDSPTAVRESADTVSGRTSLIRTDVSNVLELVPPGPRERDRFDDFWSVYPRRVGKDAARRAFAKAARSAGADVVVEGARRFAADPNLPEKQFIPHPSTWLARGSWEDEPLPPRVTPIGGAGPVREEQFAPGDEWLAFNR